MAFYTTDGELYTGDSHVLAGINYSGRTHTPTSRRLVEGEEPVRARKSDGKLLGDDPSTPDVNEAFSKPKKKAKVKSNGSKRSR